MAELFPVLSGLIVGSALGLLRPGMRLPVGIAAAIVLGTTATILSGEYEAGWEFLLIDIPLVAATSAASYTTVRALRRRHAGA